MVISAPTLYFGRTCASHAEAESLTTTNLRHLCAASHLWLVYNEVTSTEKSFAEHDDLVAVAEKCRVGSHDDYGDSLEFSKNEWTF